LTGLRALGPGLQADAVAAIDARLQAVSSEHGATVLLAVESGSRAWGFPSPDSDYDCRFIYVRNQADYLSLSPPRDVIEFPTDPILDVNGWDLAKALRLLLKGNAVVIEWLRSPIVYAGNADFRDDAMALAANVARAGAIARHYLHLGQRQRRVYFGDARTIAIKKIFYALRPAIALRWLRLHPGQAVAPMHFPTLVRQSDLDAEIVSIIEDLLARKAVTRELGRGPLPPPIGALIDSEFVIAADFWHAERAHPGDAERQAADALFRRWVLR
jgi:predicted nucleotidyltransferase